MRVVDTQQNKYQISVDIYVYMYYEEVNVDNTVPGKQLDVFAVTVWFQLYSGISIKIKEREKR